MNKTPQMCTGSVGSKAENTIMFTLKVDPDLFLKFNLTEYLCSYLQVIRIHLCLLTGDISVLV